MRIWGDSKGQRGAGREVMQGLGLGRACALWSLFCAGAKRHSATLQQGLAALKKQLRKQMGLRAEGTVTGAEKQRTSEDTGKRGGPQLCWGREEREGGGEAGKEEQPLGFEVCTGKRARKPQQPHGVGRGQCWGPRSEC